MSEEHHEPSKVETAANIGKAILSVVFVGLQIFGLFRGRPISKL